ncbi:MAG: NAD-glutamate dehydrogenase, partial [Acidobacteriota bacterium]
MNSALEEKQQLIDRLTGRTLELRTSEGAAEAAVVESFARQCFEDLSLEDLRCFDDPGRSQADHLCRVVLRLLDLSRQRETGKLRLHLFNPDLDSDGWDTDRTVIQFVTDDMPFLVDSITNEINQRELTIHQAMHPQFTVRRDAEGNLSELVRRGLTGDGIVNEAFLHFEVDRQTSPAALVDLETALRKVLADVRRAVEDYQPMQDTAGQVLEELEASTLPLAEDEINEIRAFMRWVYEDHFTFLGYLEYRLEVVGGAEYLRPLPETGLGLLRRLSLGERATSDRPLTAEAVSFLHGDRLVAISKTLSKATVHRSVHMDLISIKHFDDAGQLAGEHRFLGLFTSMAYSIGASEIPLVRRKVARVINRTRFPPVSHNAKTLRHIVENYPRDELFQISVDDLHRFALRILELQLRPRLALLVRYDEEGRFVSCLVYVPRERHSTQLRVRIQAILARAFQGEVTDYYTRISDQPLALLQCIVRTQPGEAPEVDVAAVEAELKEVVRSWSDRLKEVLGGAGGQEAGLKTWRRFRDAFPDGYRAALPASEGARDIPIIDRVLDTGELGMRLYRRPGAAATRYHFRTFERALPAPLSRFLPMLENMGFEVVTESPFEVRPAEAPNPVWVRDFELVGEGFEADPLAVRKRFEDAFARVWRGEVENDSFNRLVLRAGFSWRQVVVFRAYYKYLRQIGVTFSQQYVAQTLARHAEIADLLI